MPYCGRCGHEVPSDFRFCPHCGADLASPGGPAVGTAAGSTAPSTGGPPSGVGASGSTRAGGLGGPATKNPSPGAPSGAVGSAIQPVPAAPAAPSTGHQAHRPSIAPGLFIAAAGFLILGFAQAAVAYMVFTRVTLNLTRGSQIGYAAGFFIAGVGLVILAMMQARNHSR